MLTYMTRKSIGETARDLDDRQLGLCRVQTMQILDTLTGVSEEKANHPVMKMWTGYEFSLGIYGMMLSMEWHMNRGFADQIFFEFNNAVDEIKEGDPEASFVSPPWFQDINVLRSHRSNLLRRWPHQYGETWRVVDEDWPYLWPFIDEDEELGYKLMLSKSDKARIKSGERKLPKAVLKEVYNA